MSDNTDNEVKFTKLFRQMITAMTNPEKREVEKIQSILNELSVMFRLSRSEVCNYRNLEEEKNGGGEIVCSYDTGEEHKLVIGMRVQTSVMSVTRVNVYMAPNAEPLSSDEKEKVELVMRSLLSYVSRNKLRDIIEELAFFDDSGYRNQRSLWNYIAKTDARGQLGDKAAICYNLLHYTLVNQEYGRKLGDEIMRSHYNGLGEMLDQDECQARLGGDNFTAIFKKEKLEKVLDYLSGTAVSYGGGSVRISASVGVFDMSEGKVPNGPAEVMSNMIAASRAAQSGGKEHIVFYNDELLAKREKSMRVQKSFPEALRNKEFHVFYQPKVNIETGELSGAEALCRWIKDGKIVPPLDFIPALEETTDICKLDFYMLEHVCMDLRRWLDEGKNIVRTSVNFSRKHMMDMGLLKNIIDIVDKYGIPHKFIEIELTETTTDVEFLDLKRIVGGLQQAGICTSVDDFGIGYSSLNLIRAIPWDVLKVDKSFLPVDEDKSTSVRSIMFRHVVSMARELGLECIAEGVETSAQLDVLRENGCDIAQGFYFDRPLPVEEFEKRLEKHFYEK